MEGFLKRAKSFAEEAAKPNKIAGTAKKSRELALEASNKADEFKTAVLRQADQIQFQSLSKSISDNIPPQLSSLSVAAPGSYFSDPPQYTIRSSGTLVSLMI
ncbi:hypothetical protein F3Y22_tig00109972pilonHSYRG00315 [Hibiscus syriacus]|uniref:Uncharacterized protein n=1 Tax=Hibiscus syriacus TaxID=106335 RepID=A0A6A3BRH4_HIBSY|nr:hypothetical protein F3Y22_tig00109972pilonHSYRG00315 [Hibiscus syriacus]